MFPLEIRAQGTPGGIESGVVQRRCSRGAANPVGSEKLFGHGEESVAPESDPGQFGES
jgi:hypothetical protein